MRRTRAKAAVASLPPDMLANIHGRLSLLDRMSFAAAFPTSRDAFMPEAPCLVLRGGTQETATLFSLYDHRAVAARAPGPDHVVLGSSSRGWLVTADHKARMRLVNPVTGEQRALPPITTIPCIEQEWGLNFVLIEQKDFVRGPPYRGGGRPDRPPGGTFQIPAKSMPRWFYHKVVLSDTAAIALLITGRLFGGPAFATAGGGAWRLAPSRDDVEDAVHYNGKFYSITYTGAVEVWEQQDADAGDVFTSTVVAPRLLHADHRKYLVTAPDGRLMVVLEESKDTWHGCCRRRIFKMQIFDAGGEQWKVTDDIGDAALFVGVNSWVCVSTRQHPELRAGRVYYTENDVGPCKDGHNREQSGVGIFSLKDGRAEKVEGLGRHRSWPPPAWFIPFIP